jgi:hypothetical protein
VDRRGRCSGCRDEAGNLRCRCRIGDDYCTLEEPALLRREMVQKVAPAERRGGTLAADFIDERRHRRK